MHLFARCFFFTNEPLFNFKKVLKKLYLTPNSIDEVELIAVSKKPKEDIQNVIDHHQRSFGENQIQEVEESGLFLRE